PFASQLPGRAIPPLRPARVDPNRPLAPRPLALAAPGSPSRLGLHAGEGFAVFIAIATRGKMKVFDLRALQTCGFRTPSFLTIFPLAPARNFRYHSDDQFALFEGVRALP